jgi:hypothetical protein
MCGGRFVPRDECKGMMYLKQTYSRDTRALIGLLDATWMQTRQGQKCTVGTSGHITKADLLNATLVYWEICEARSPTPTSLHGC